MKKPPTTSTERAKRIRYERNSIMAKWLLEFGHAEAREMGRKAWPTMRSRILENIIYDAETKVNNYLRGDKDALKCLKP